MALTASLKEELSGLETRTVAARKAETAAMLRFAGGLYTVSGRLVIQAELDLLSTAQHLAAAIAALYRRPSQIHPVPGTHSRPGGSYLVRIGHDSHTLARQIGLLDVRGQPVRGLPPAVVNGTLADAEAVWAGAFLAQGSLTEAGRASGLGITCPSPEAALALQGAARRLGIDTTTRDIHGTIRVVIRDENATADMLARMGAPTTRALWQALSRHKDTTTTAATGAANFETSNQRRSAEAARQAVARVQQALHTLGDNAPENLKQAGQLRIAHPEASLEELGRLADPPQSKDTIAGRIRRLLKTADKHTTHQNAPATET